MFNQSAYDKFCTAARDAMLVKGWAGQSLPQTISTFQGPEQSWNPTEGRRNLAFQSAQRLARECLVMEGGDRQKIDNLAPMDLARAALGLMNGAEAYRLGVSASMAGSYNTTGTFPNIMLDAANVMARRAYEEVPTTYQLWAKRRSDVSDFRDIHAVMLSGVSDPKAVPEDGEFEESTCVDGRESYKLTVWGHRFSLTYQVIVNDQPGVFLTMANRHGAAMRRKQNKLVYDIFKTNPVLSDNGALFNATAVSTPGGHANLVTAGGVPSVATLNAGYAMMARQRGLEADGTALGIEPRFLIHTPNLRGTVLQLIGSTANPDAGNSGAANIWHNALTPITEPQLSAVAGGSDDWWFLVAGQDQVDTIEYAFLDGYEEPMIESQRSFERLAIVHRIWQPFATKALDYRGLFQNDGVT